MDSRENKNERIRKLAEQIGKQAVQIQELDHSCKVKTFFTN